MKKLTIGVLAHVDSGKTTLSEALLYAAGSLRKLGRVDHGDAFLDTHTIERERGITIFSKQAVFPLGECEATLLDTPGHVDFSSEMERTLQVLDCAILVISGTDGVQSHTRTLWRLLKHHAIPTFLFINKMDLAGADRAAVLHALQQKLDSGCVDFFGESEQLHESAAMTDEEAMEEFLSEGVLRKATLRRLIEERKLFPCCFGAALKNEGVGEFLRLLEEYAPTPAYGDAFAARVFKIAREGGERLTYLKITGGALKVRTPLQLGEMQEKVNQIRIYSGSKYKTVDTAEAGTVCAVTGLTATRPGDALGAEAAGEQPMLEPVLTYRLVPPDTCDEHTMLGWLRELEEEDPQLRILWKESLREIHVQLMGEVQLEILQRLIAERFGVTVSFDEGSIVYKETIADTVLGIGHYEPLRHYAECHLLMEPLARGSGIRFASACSTDALDLNWQRLILTHIAEKQHLGVLTGSALTDVKISLIAGRAHLKHTEGGDFRQATYRAIRHGLMQAESVLLEPCYEFQLEVPQENLGRAIADIQTMGGEFAPPEILGEDALLTGTAPVAAMRGYSAELAAYSKGRGRLTCTVKGYVPCQNAAAVIEKIGYEAERDLENTADSVFCSHGAGVVVHWKQVRAQAHIEPLKLKKEDAEEEKPIRRVYGGAVRSAGEQELEEIFTRTYGPIRNRGMEALRQRSTRPVTVPEQKLGFVQRGDVLLVDGYNIIFAWDDLKKLAKDSLDAARSALIHALCNYQGVKGCRLVLVFDAYRVKGGEGSVEQPGNIEVVYTKEGETADMYIERMSYELGRSHRVKVATSDGLEQIMISGHGAQRVSAGDLRWELNEANKAIQEFLSSQ